MNRLRGKRALITGAGGGIGRDVAHRFAQEGARVGAVDLDAAGVTALAAEWVRSTWLCVPIFLASTMSALA